MYRAGHIGIALVVYCPIASVILYKRWYTGFLTGGVLFLMMAIAPDVDTVISTLEHRGITHTIPGAIIAGLVTANATRQLLATEFLNRPPRSISSEWTHKYTVTMYGFLLGFLGVLIHVLTDFLTPMGVSLFYPITDVKLSVSLFYAANPEINAVFLETGCIAVTAVTTSAIWWHGKKHVFSTLFPRKQQ